MAGTAVILQLILLFYCGKFLLKSDSEYGCFTEGRSRDQWCSVEYSTQTGELTPPPCRRGFRGEGNQMHIHCTNCTGERHCLLHLGGAWVCCKKEREHTATGDRIGVT